jgi:tetratricopeptide (TPR) repeat protein
MTSIGGQVEAAKGGAQMPLAQVLALADQRRQAGQLAAAEDLCRQALQAHPGHPATLHLLAIILHQRGDLGTAIDMVRQAVGADGQVALYHANLGEMCRQAGRLEESITASRRALALAPQNPHTLNNLGIAYYDAEAFDQARECYRHAIEIASDFAEAHNNLGNLLRALGGAGDALAHYRRAVTLKPDYVDAHSNLAMTLLLVGEFETGWRELEWRRRRHGRGASASLKPDWQGESFAGKTLFLCAEEGHGDAIQFLRYWPEVAARGGDVVLAVHRPLLRLARRRAPGARVILLEAPPPPFDLYCPLMSLPRVLGTTLETVPAEVPYLSVDDEVVERWRARLSAAPGLRVGLVWSGAVKYGHNRHRAMPAERLAPLLEIEGVRWFSLQVGERAAELGKLPSDRIVDLSSELTDFAETGGALLGLDLVIATDTAVPHLAAALGQPAWVMLASMPDWRWLLDRDTSPWYPTMRLFRQRARGDWAEVVERVAKELRAVMGGERGRLTPPARGRAERIS